MAFSEFPNFLLEDRFSSYPTRLLSFRVAALETSHFVQGGDHGVAQQFYFRSLNPDPSLARGKLVISFSADQFSDAAVGDVWDGTMPSSLAKLRESQFAQIVKNGDQVRPPKPELFMILPTIPQRILLPHFLVLRGGREIMEGHLRSEQPDPHGRRGISLGLDPDLYLAELQTLALKFIDQNCKILGDTGFCPENLFGIDYVEWSVTYKTDKSVVTALELVHDSKLSGLGNNYNIVFLSK